MKTFVLQLLSVIICVGMSSQLAAQCADNPITNAGFESGAFADWWNWHDGDPDAYSFESSDDAYAGDSSAVIRVLVDTDQINGGQGGEFNNRPQTIPVVGGEFYEISLATKSTLDDTQIAVWVKDENDGWITIHNTTLTVGTEWSVVSTIFQADVDREDVHIELKTRNEDFHEPYSVWFDEVAICQVEINTFTCADNIVTNPGFEDGADVDWWNWHGNNPDGYSFETSTESFIGDGSALIRTLVPSSELSGAGEFNSRPQVSPVVADQNYRVSVIGKSTVENTAIQLWVKDEFDGWTTIGNADLIIGTEWTEVSFVFENTSDRDDVHIEIKVFNADFSEPYDVWFDEVSICKTDDDPSTGEPEPEQEPVFGSASVFTECNNNLAPVPADDDADGDGIGWEMWDGSDDDVLSTFSFDPVLPYSGANSVRIDVNEESNVAEFHHRFGDRMTLEDGEEYTISVWLRADIADGDTLNVFTRAVRDTDWEAQTFVDFLVVSNEWLNFTHTFTADGTWDNAFLEFKCQRWNGFTSAYSVWLDDMSICAVGDATTGTDDLETLGVDFLLSPNPTSAYSEVNLNIQSIESLDNTAIRVVDVLGRVVWVDQIDIVSGEQNIRIPTNSLTAGLYLVNLQYEGYVKTLKLQVVNR